MKKMVIHGCVDELNTVENANPDAIIVRDDDKMIAFQKSSHQKALVHGIEGAVRNRFPSLDDAIVSLVAASDFERLARS